MCATAADETFSYGTFFIICAIKVHMENSSIWNFFHHSRTFAPYARFFLRIPYRNVFLHSCTIRAIWPFFCGLSTGRFYGTVVHMCCKTAFFRGLPTVQHPGVYLQTAYIPVSLQARIQRIHYSPLYGGFTTAVNAADSLQPWIQRIGYRYRFSGFTTVEDSADSLQLHIRRMAYS